MYMSLHPKPFHLTFYMFEVCLCHFEEYYLFTTYYGGLSTIYFIYFVGGATCIAWGDPHYLTFDKQRHDFMGICKYTMAEPCKDFGSMPNFTVAVQNERRYNRDKVSFAKYVDIHVYKRHIVLGKGLQITVSYLSLPKT